MSAPGATRSPRAWARCAPAAAGLCPQRTQDLLAALQREIDRGRLPGAVVLLARRGQVALFESLGVQDPATRRPMAADAIFRIYSMTKPVVSLAVLRLMEQGRVFLHDPVARHLPEFAEPRVAVTGAEGQVTYRAPLRSATVHDLLRHTAGLTYEFLGTSVVQQAYARAQIGSRERDNAAFSQLLASLPLAWDPGSVWEYSRATDVLGRLIEVITGESLADHLQQTVFAPLGVMFQ